MEILHTSNILKAKITFEDLDLEDKEKRNLYCQKTPTTTLPLLETPQGNISQSMAIEIFLANKFNPDFLGRNIVEKSKVNQWIEFASCEIQNCLKELIYPIFHWKELDKELSEKADKNLKKYLRILEKEFNGKKYILGDKMTLADVILFRYLRFFMMLYLTDNIRKSLIPKLTKWFESIMNSPEAIDAYGRTILCQKQIKPNKVEKDKVNKNNVAKINPLDFLPDSSFDLDSFKKEFFSDGNKKEIMEKFWKIFDPKGYSIYFLEYKHLDIEGKKLFRMKNSKNFFLERFDEAFKRYSFGVYGVYGHEGDYKVRGVWLWRGGDIPNEIKDNDYFKYLDIKKMNSENESDRKMIEDYWTKTNKKEKVNGREVADVTYFS